MADYDNHSLQQKLMMELLVFVRQREKDEISFLCAFFAQPPKFLSRIGRPPARVSHFHPLCFPQILYTGIVRKLLTYSA